jgi:hypothetical protein
MKTILKIAGQIILILLVAGFISGALYAAVHYNILSMPTRGEHFEGRTLPGQPGAESNFRGGEGFENHERGNRGPNLFRGMFGLLGSLLKLTVIVVLVLFIQNLFNRRQSRQTPNGA